MLAGTSTRSINPLHPVRLAGSGFERLASALESGDLEVNVVAFRESRAEPPVILVSFDLLYVGVEVVNRVRDRFNSIPPERIIMAASHTHQAPMTDPTKPSLGKYDVDYVDLVSDRTVEAITEALGVMDAVRISVGTAIHDGSINRRRRAALALGRKPRVNAIAIAPNPDGPRDETVTVFRIESSSGVPIAAVWSYACHPVAYPEPDAVSAHYPGRVRSSIRDKVSDHRLPVVFLQGFSGNTRPRYSSDLSRRKRLSSRLIGRPGFQKPSRECYEEWCRGLASAVLGEFFRSNESVGGGVDVRRRRIPLEQLVSLKAGPGEAEREFEVVGIRIARLHAVFVTAEVMAEFAIALREKYPDRVVVPVGCVNDSFGYLPTTQIMREGGYEGRGFFQYFAVSGLVKELPETAWRCITDA